MVCLTFLKKKKSVLNKEIPQEKRYKKQLERNAEKLIKEARKKKLPSNYNEWKIWNNKYGPAYKIVKKKEGNFMREQIKRKRTGQPFVVRTNSIDLNNTNNDEYTVEFPYQMIGIILDSTIDEGKRTIEVKSIKETNEGKYAFTQGVRENDVIIKYQNEEIPDNEEIMDFAKRIMYGPRPFTLTFIRKNPL